MKIEIIRPSLEHSFDMAHIHVRTWQYAYYNLLDNNFLNNLSVKNKTEIWARRLVDTESGFIIFAAKIKDKIVGYIFGGLSQYKSERRYDCEVYAYYILPEYQNIGVGKKLFKTFTKEAIARGYRNICLWCLAGNKTEEFYKHIGGIYKKSKKIAIPPTSKTKYKNNMYIYPDLKILLKNLK